MANRQLIQCPTVPGDCHLAPATNASVLISLCRNTISDTGIPYGDVCPELKLFLKCSPVRKPKRYGAEPGNRLITVTAWRHCCCRVVDGKKMSEKM